MYPNLYFFFKETFGVQIPFLRFINSFGFFVAISFLVAAALLTRELKRKSSQGLMQPTEMKHTVGKPATISELLTNFRWALSLVIRSLRFFSLVRKPPRTPRPISFREWAAGRPVSSPVYSLPG